jgi:malate dehydrogenase (oxaloacetate-decarboxylating)
LDIPVMHDDQHGTAVVTTAFLLVACKRLKKDLSKAVIGQVGLGAAGNAIAQMLMQLTGQTVWGADLSDEAMKLHASNGGQCSSLQEIMKNCEVIISTTGAPGLIKPEMVRKGQIILALSNPNPEIDPEVARKAGAAFAADGKSVNNVLGFPGIFRGAVDADVPRITREMLVAAARAIAESAPPGDIVPDPLDKALHRRVARAVARTALEQGLNRDDLTGYFD